MTKATNNFTCSVTEAAEILHVHSSTVEKLIAGGVLPAGAAAGACWVTVAWSTSPALRDTPLR